MDRPPPIPGIKVLPESLGDDQNGHVHPIDVTAYRPIGRSLAVRAATGTVEAAYGKRVIKLKATVVLLPVFRSLAVSVGTRGAEGRQSVTRPKSSRGSR